MSQFRDRAKQYHDGISRILLDEWDPIGVTGIPEAADEYDSYVQQIYGMLIRQEPARKIYDFLWWAETENMGLRGNGPHTEKIAQRLIALRDEIQSLADNTQ